ncbi:glycosyltransferase family 2 protein [Bacteroidota bacterium]
MNVGNSEDGTMDMIRSIPSDKIEIIESQWDDSTRRNGEVLSQETNKAFDHIPDEYDWAFYIQADEVVHEKYHDLIRKSMEKWMKHPEVEGLLFNYLHFFGSFDYNADSRSWYRNEIRIIRNNKKIRSYKDAQGFRIGNRKLRVKPAEAYMYHYGWVRPPEIMQQKHVNFNKLYHSDQWVDRKVNHTKLYDYSSVESIIKFSDSHPEVMKERIRKLNWDIELDENKKSFKTVDRILYWIEQQTGKRLFEYQNYKLI